MKGREGGREKEKEWEGRRNLGREGGVREREGGRKGGREGGRWEGGRPYMCKHVAGKIVKQYYRHSIQCHLSVPISG